MAYLRRVAVTEFQVSNRAECRCPTVRRSRWRHAALNASKASSASKARDSAAMSMDADIRPALFRALAASIPAFSLAPAPICRMFPMACFRFSPRSHPCAPPSRPLPALRSQSWIAARGKIYRLPTRMCGISSRLSASRTERSHMPRSWASAPTLGYVLPPADALVLAIDYCPQLPHNTLSFNR